MQVASFTPEGTLAAAAAKLQHMASLGFTAVQLMPIAEHSDAWGYNPRQLLSLHGAFGSPDVSWRCMRTCIYFLHYFGMFGCIYGTPSPSIAAFIGDACSQCYRQESDGCSLLFSASSTK